MELGCIVAGCHEQVHLNASELLWPKQHLKLPFQSSEWNSQQTEKRS